MRKKQDPFHSVAKGLGIKNFFKKVLGHNLKPEAAALLFFFALSVSLSVILLGTQEIIYRNQSDQLTETLPPHKAQRVLGAQKTSTSTDEQEIYRWSGDVPDGMAECKKLGICQ